MVTMAGPAAAIPPPATLDNNDIVPTSDSEITDIAIEQPITRVRTSPYATNVSRYVKRFLLCTTHT